MRVFITGIAGFVGTTLARAFRRDFPQAQIHGLDNLKRRGSELNLSLLKKAGVEFYHGDIRCPEDLQAVDGNFDLFIEASAEPSVLAGAAGPGYVLQTNLVGTLNCLEFARKRCGLFAFLSTSRVYSLSPLRALSLEERVSRFELSSVQRFKGVTAGGISEGFPTDSPRSLYGGSKLASEIIVQEYANTFGLNVILNRCGVIAGPGQFGKVDQGVYTLWVAHHYFGLPLKYTGFKGEGKQVRDLLHPEDLYKLLRLQIASKKVTAEVFNVGGGPENSISLAELTALCEKTIGRSTELSSSADTHAMDIPYYVSDNSKVREFFGWEPQISVPGIVEAIFRWLKENEASLRPLFQFPPSAESK